MLSSINDVLTNEKGMGKRNSYFLRISYHFAIIIGPSENDCYLLRELYSDVRSIMRFWVSKNCRFSYTRGVRRWPNSRERQILNDTGTERDECCVQVSLGTLTAVPVGKTMTIKKRGVTEELFVRVTAIVSHYPPKVLLDSTILTALLLLLCFHTSLDCIKAWQLLCSFL